MLCWMYGPSLSETRVNPPDTTKRTSIFWAKYNKTISGEKLPCIYRYNIFPVMLHVPKIKKADILSFCPNCGSISFLTGVSKVAVIMSLWKSNPKDSSCSYDQTIFKYPQTLYNRHIYSFSGRTTSRSACLSTGHKDILNENRMQKLEIFSCNWSNMFNSNRSGVIYSWIQLKPQKPT